MYKLLNFKILLKNRIFLEVFLFSLFLLSILIIGEYGLYDYAYILQVIFLLIFYKLKVKPIIFIFNVISIILLIFFSKIIDTKLITICFFLFILSFDITSKFYIYISKLKLLFLTFFFSLLMISLMEPYVNVNDKNHGYLFELKIIEDPKSTYTPIQKKYYEEYLNNKPYLLYSIQNNDIYNSLCLKEKSCEQINLIKYNRYRFNGLDANFSSLIFAIIFLLLSVLTKNINHKFLIVTSGFILVYIFTKSRFLFPCICSYYFYLIFKDKLNIKNSVLIIIITILSYFSFIYFFLNEYSINEYHKLSNTTDPNVMYRIFSIIDSSSLSKFNETVLALKEIILNFNTFILPSFYLKLINPHNIFLNLVLDFGYVISFIIFFNIFQNFKNKKFLQILYPLIIGSIFLGAQVFILINLILIIVNLKVKSNE
jgi:hypothetical protein